MHAGVEKREHPEHAAEAHEFGASGQPAQRRDRQRRQQQAQRPVAAAVFECGTVCRIAALSSMPPSCSFIGTPANRPSHASGTRHVTNSSAFSAIT